MKPFSASIHAGSQQYRATAAAVTPQIASAEEIVLTGIATPQPSVAIFVPALQALTTNAAL